MNSKIEKIVQSSEWWALKCAYKCILFNIQVKSNFMGVLLHLTKYVENIQLYKKISLILAIKYVITLSDPNLPFYVHCSHKRKLFRPGHGRHGIIVIFSNPCQLHLIYWLLQGFHELCNANTLYMALEICSESK